MASSQQAGPGVGDLARDSTSGKIGVVMGEFGGRVHLRPVNGGVEWGVESSNVVSLTAREELNVRNTARNAASRSIL
ncbi:hypothetical protein ABZ707_02440 [Streptomyces sp. NPDC006923]|uniref:hypothetical protein n=1 Tax=Streptomyces sp. NPDC006923 TaxID=3155355 RepID=UPI003400BC4A